MPRVTKATNKKETKSTGKVAIAASNSVATSKVEKAKTTAKKVAEKVVKKTTASKATSKVPAKKTVAKSAKKVVEKTSAPKSTSKVATKKIAEKTSKAKTTSVSTKKTSSTDTKKSTTKKATTTTTKTTAKKATTSKKSPAKSSKKVTSKAPAKKTVSKSSKSKTSTTLKKKPTAKKPKVSISEYYDLPYRYNQTVVKILAQTPNTLFVYWDISDADREKYVKEFGEYFFNDTFPVLIVHNKTMNYSFEIEVNDFANSWYFHVSDAKCDYEIEFGRRKKAFREISIPNDYVYISSSNVIEAPNDKFLFEPNTRNLFFRNVKTNQEFSKDIATLSFMEKINKIYNIYDIYKEIYKEEDLIDAMNNPTSSGSGLSFYQKN